MEQVGGGGGAVSICDDKSRRNILLGAGHASGFGSKLHGWGWNGQAVVKPSDKNFIAFSGEVELISPVQILIISGGWQLVEKKMLKKILEPENK